MDLRYLNKTGESIVGSFLMSIRSRCGNSSDTSSERIDQQGLTYGEVDFASFLSILHASHSRDNHVFVDLVTFCCQYSNALQGMRSG